MKNLIVFIVLSVGLVSLSADAQNIDSLRAQFHRIIDGKNAVVGAAVQGYDGKDTVSINGDRFFPMQSVYKYHISLAVLNQVDKGKLILNQDVRISKEDVTTDLYSPIKDRYPDGVTMKLSDVIRHTITESDNVGCDVLLGLIGGTDAAESYIKDNGIEDIAIVYDEKTQQSNWENQFENLTTPGAANLALVKFYENKNNLLSDSSYNFLWETMKGTVTGKNSIRGELPPDYVVAHKTGHSGINDQRVTAAVNDIGIVFLPDGRYFYISVFVSNSTEDEETNQKIISGIAKAARDYFLSKYSD